MSIFQRFDIWTDDQVAGQVHNLSDHDFFIYLSNTTPDKVNDNVKADLAEIATGFGYAGAIDTINTFTNAGKIYTMFGESILITASGGTIGPLRHVVLFNFETLVKTDPLVGFWDHGQSISILDGATHEILFNNSPVGVAGAMLTLQSLV